MVRDSNVPWWSMDVNKRTGMTSCNSRNSLVELSHREVDVAKLDIYIFSQLSS